MNRPFFYSLARATLFVGVVLTGGLLACWPARSQQTPTQSYVITLDGEQMTYQQLREQAQRRIDWRAWMASFEGWKMIAQEVALTRALVREGQALGIDRPAPASQADDDPIFADERYAFEVYKRLANSCDFDASAEDALQAYYKDHPEAFRVPARVRLERIMLRDGTAVGPLPAPMWLSLQARAVVENQAKFENLIARAREAAPDIYQGDLGWQVIDDDIDLLAALGQAEVGNMVGPVKEGDFWILLRVIDKRAAFVPQWKDVERQAATIASEHCRTTERRRITQQLSEKYHLRIDYDALRTAVQRNPAQ